MVTLAHESNSGNAQNIKLIMVKLFSSPASHAPMRIPIQSHCIFESPVTYLSDPTKPSVLCHQSHFLSYSVRPTLVHYIGAALPLPDKLLHASQLYNMFSILISTFESILALSLTFTTRKHRGCTIWLLQTRINVSRS